MLIEQTRALYKGCVHMIREKITWIGLGALFLSICGLDPLKQVLLDDISPARGLADTLANLSKAFESSLFRLVLLVFGLWFFGVAALRVAKKIETAETEKKNAQIETAEKMALEWYSVTELPIRIAQAAAFRQEVANFKDKIDQLKENTIKENERIIDQISRTRTFGTNNTYEWMFFPYETHMAGRYKNFKTDFEPYKPDYPQPYLVQTENGGYAYDPETPENQRYQIQMKAIASARLNSIAIMEGHYDAVLPRLHKIESDIEKRLANGK